MEEKILDKLEVLEKKIDELTAYIKGKHAEHGHTHTPVPEESPIVAPKPSQIAAKVEGDSIDSLMMDSERLICPKCQTHNIQAMDNKEKPLSMSGGIMIYSKKFYCKKCAYQWE